MEARDIVAAFRHDIAWNMGEPLPGFPAETGSYIVACSVADIDHDETRSWLQGMPLCIHTTGALRRLADILQDIISGHLHRRRFDNDGQLNICGPTGAARVYFIQATGQAFRFPNTQEEVFASVMLIGHLNNDG